MIQPLMTREHLRRLHERDSDGDYTAWLETMFLLALRLVRITPAMLEQARTAAKRGEIGRAHV